MTWGPPPLLRRVNICSCYLTHGSWDKKHIQPPRINGCIDLTDTKVPTFVHTNARNASPDPPTPFPSITLTWHGRLALSEPAMSCQRFRSETSKELSRDISTSFHRMLQECLPEKKKKKKTLSKQHFPLRSIIFGMIHNVGIVKPLLTASINRNESVLCAVVQHSLMLYPMKATTF